jgi:hypothetical protein
VVGGGAGDLQPVLVNAVTEYTSLRRQHATASAWRRVRRADVGPVVE